MDKLWVEKYRPKTISECVLPDRIKKVFEQFVSNGHCPNLLLSGPAGSGKCLDYDTLLSLKVDVKTAKMINNFIKINKAGIGNDNLQKNEEIIHDIELVDIEVSIGDLFGALGLDNLNDDCPIPNIHQIYIKTPDGMSKVNYFVSKLAPKIKICTRGGKEIVCATKHILVDSDFAAVYADIASEIATIDGIDHITSKTRLPDGKVFDISIDEPHLYITTNGIIHHNTSIARALSSELGADVLFVNASMEGSIDTLRGKIKTFASTVSFSDTSNKKIVILDEAEGSSTSQSFQPALRAFMETFSSNCMFILTCNFKNRLIEPIHSRCSVIEFVFTKDEKIKMQGEMFQHILNILANENIQADKGSVAQMVQKFFPDFRRLLNELQKYGALGKIDTGILANVGDIRMDEIMLMLKEKQFGDMRKWAVSCSDIGDALIYRAIYDSLYDYLKPSSIPAAVLIIAEYQYKSAFCADSEINLVACLVTIMMDCEFT